jgi:hypothetical protein
MNGPQDGVNPRLGPRAIRPLWVAALVAGGILSCWATFRIEQRLSSPPSPPGTRQVTFDVVVSDVATGKAISGAEVGIDHETGEFDPPGPTWMGITDARGRARLAHDFEANTVLGKDGKVRGRVVFNAITTPGLVFSYLVVVRAIGYREETIRLGAHFPRGIAYEDPSPQTIPVRLSPEPAQ